jgi:acetolactate synthase-1/2/3 large subunit
MPVVDATALDAAARLIAGAERPLILAGHGIILGNASEDLRIFAEHTGIPVITTLLGISAFPEDHPLHLGMPGMHGEVHVNRAIQHADLLIAVGMRFDDRVTGNTAGFARNAKIVHIELDPTEIGKNVPVEVPLVGDAGPILSALTQALAPRSCTGWWEEIDASRRPTHEQFRGDIAPETILRALHDASGGTCSIVADVGQHQMWVAKFFPYRRLNTHFSSGGLGAMGFAVPAAIGVHLARPDEPVWAISGDGGFQMNMQEMATMVQEGLPIKLAIFNNGYLGMVRQWQQFFHGGRYSNTPIWSPDYVKLAAAYGIPGWRVKQAGEVTDALRQANETPGPTLVELVIEQEANVFPMIVPGGSLSEPLEAAPV